MSKKKWKMGQIFVAFSKYLNFNISFFFSFSEAKSASRRKKSRFLLTIFVSTQAANCASTVRDFVNWYLPKIVTIIPREFSAWLIRTRIIGCASTSTPSSWLNYLPTTKTEWLSFFLRSSIQTVRLVMCTACMVKPSLPAQAPSRFREVASELRSITRWERIIPEFTY